MDQNSHANHYGRYGKSKFSGFPFYSQEGYNTENKNWIKTDSGAIEIPGSFSKEPDDKYHFEELIGGDLDVQGNEINDSSELNGGSRYFLNSHSHSEYGFEEDSSDD